ncbi:MAG TPA: T9SS type A sorting domain-containing protein, partial [Flavobacteriales bacterium]|nr:T9SS type A sorting domain-containing protein [Flavobacteriales bacterium]
EHSSTAMAFWPNPTTDRFNIHLTDAIAPVHVTITDITGRVIAEAKQLASGLVTMDATQWSAGVYTVRCQLPDRIYSGTLVKQ